uniref:Putative ubiquinone biosynthesis protein UbiB n=1 Tax=Anthurium amnicola TaxID=1678845 RepID=A0A1D1YMH4_9ARAE
MLPLTPPTRTLLLLSGRRSWLGARPAPARGNSRIPPPRRRHHFSMMMGSSAVGQRAPATVKLRAIEATPASFAEFGQVISTNPDGGEFGPSDAQLELHRGVPRFYIMHLEDRKLKFSKITHHASVTQCLGSVGGDEWYLGVAKASILEGENVGVEMGKKVVKSACGHYYVPPQPDNVFVFRIAGPKFLKLDIGTWHAGPLFRQMTMDFYNLELSNTNE